MKKYISAEKEKQYQQFDKKLQCIIRISIIILVAILICLAIGFKVVDLTYIPLLISLGLLLIYAISMILICKRFRSIRDSLFMEAYGIDTDYIRTGIFADIWDEYEDNRFEGLFDSKTKVNFLQSHNNYIEMTLIRNNHEFNISIDENSIDCLVDEETDCPHEISKSLSKFKEADEVLIYLQDIIKKQC